MYLLFECALGYALFKIKNGSKLKDPEFSEKYLIDLDSVKETLKYVAHEKFRNVGQALKASKRMVDGRISKKLSKLFDKCEKLKGNTLGVSNIKTGSSINELFNIECTSGFIVNELTRAVREHFKELIPDFDKLHYSNMVSGLAHNICRTKLKYNPDKIDTMVVQSIALLDDVDKEINNSVMRIREWYGWHFPELGKIVNDNLKYIELVYKILDRKDIEKCILSDIVDNALENEIRLAANVSMGSEITEEDMKNISEFCEQSIKMTEYRTQLNKYLNERMHLIAPNLSSLVGEVVGARLIAHAGSMMNLAKQPSSTIQLLGAEKALFNALKTRKNTPKYGLIFHSTLVSQAPISGKGRISRSLAAKCALAIRFDSLCENTGLTNHTKNNLNRLKRQVLSYEHDFNRKKTKINSTQVTKPKTIIFSESRSYSTTNDTKVYRKRKADSMNMNDMDEVEDEHKKKKS